MAAAEPTVYRVNLPNVATRLRERRGPTTGPSQHSPAGPRPELSTTQAL
jgi:hypothetical protein